MPATSPAASREPSAVRAWLVDLDGTLYHACWVKLLLGLELGVLGLGAVSTLRRFRHEHERLRQQNQAADDLFRLQITLTARALAQRESAVEALVQTWMFERPLRWLRLFRRRALLRELQAFRAAGGKTALVSDYPAKKKLAALGAEALFDCVIASGEPGGPKRLKPAPDGYLSAARTLGVDPRDCIVIGDRQDADGRAAQAAQMAFRLVR